jgi:hypothetical protein
MRTYEEGCAAWTARRDDDCWYEVWKNEWLKGFGMVNKNHWRLRRIQEAEDMLAACWAANILVSQ